MSCIVESLSVVKMSPRLREPESLYRMCPPFYSPRGHIQGCWAPIGGPSDLVKYIQHGALNALRTKILSLGRRVDLLTRRASTPYAGPSRPQSGAWYAGVFRGQPWWREVELMRWMSRAAQANSCSWWRHPHTRRWDTTACLGITQRTVQALRAALTHNCSHR
jgi:hypothetical protein